MKKNSGHMLTGLTPTAVSNFEAHIESLEADRQALQKALIKVRSLEAELSLARSEIKSLKENHYD